MSLLSRFRTTAVLGTLALVGSTARPAKVSAQQYLDPHAAHEAQEERDRAAKAALDAEQDQQRAMNHAAHEAAEHGR